MPQVADYERWNNPYDSSVATAGGVATDLLTDAPIEELRAYVGPNADHYLRKWAPRLLDPNADVRISWIAFFFPTLWLAYRKMFLLGLAVFGVDFGITVVSALVFPFNSGKYLALALSMRFVMIVVCCVFANSWYLNHALRAIATARAQGYEDEQLRRVLSQRGGTSGWLLVGMFFLTGMLSAIGRIILVVATGVAFVR